MHVPWQVKLLSTPDAKGCVHAALHSGPFQTCGAAVSSLCSPDS